MQAAVVDTTGPVTDAIARLELLARGATQSVTGLLIALAILLVGWAVAVILANMTRGLLRALRFDQVVARMSGSPVVAMVAQHEPSRIAGNLVLWLVLAGAAVLALEALGYRLAAQVAGRLEEVVPRIVTAAILLAIGTLLARAVGSLTRRFFESAEVRAPRVYGQIVTAVLVGFAVLVALEQLGFAAQFVMAIGVVAVAAVGLGLALAFGLGCRDLVRDFLIEYLRSLEEERPKRPL